MAYAVLVIAAWGLAIMRLPVWLAVLLGVGFTGFGAILVVFGAAGIYWNSHMMPSNHGPYWTLGTGVLLLLSQLVPMTRLVLRALAPPPEP